MCQPCHQCTLVFAAFDLAATVLLDVCRRPYPNACLVICNVGNTVHRTAAYACPSILMEADFAGWQGQAAVPQQQLLLEHANHALRRATCDAPVLAGNTSQPV